MPVHQMVLQTHTAAETAGTDVTYYEQLRLPGKWLVKSVAWLSEIAVTADPTNYATLTVANVTASQTIATRSYAATNSVAGVPEVLATPTGLAQVISEGDVISLAKVTPGNGVAVRGKMILEIEQAPLP